MRYRALRHEQDVLAASLEREGEEVRRLLAPEGEVLVAEPVIHVRRRQFERTVAVARQAGLTLKKRPGIAFSMSAVFGL